MSVYIYMYIYKCVCTYKAKYEKVLSHPSTDASYTDLRSPPLPSFTSSDLINVLLMLV